MSKRRYTSASQADPREENDSGSETETAQETGTITSASQAIALVREKYQVPTGAKIVYVAEDTQVFFSRGPAILHTRNRMKLFSIQAKWD